MADGIEILAAASHGVGTITLNRPGRLNAYTPDMGDELVDALRAMIADPAIAAIVVTGAGRAFCAGADRAFLDGSRGRNGLRIGEEFFITGFAAELFAAEKPLIAAVNGAAVGIGATMLLPFDIRIAAPAASFGFPFPRLGLMPGMGSTCFLPHVVGEARARQILLTGATLDAAAALNAGLVTEVCDDPLARAETLARAMADADRNALAAMKRALGRDIAPTLTLAIEAERRESAALAQRRKSGALPPKSGA